MRMKANNKLGPLKEVLQESLTEENHVYSPDTAQTVLPLLKEESYIGDNFYRYLIETVPEIIFSLTPKGKITFLNSAFENLTGWSRKDWIGKPFTELLGLEDRGNFSEVFYGHENGSLNSPLDIMLKLKAGGHLAAEVTAVPQVRGGKIIRILGSVRDVTERRRTEEMLALQKRRIRSLYEISSEPGIGIEGQIVETLKTGTEMLGLEIAIIGHIVGRNYTVGYCYDKLGKVTQGTQFDFDKTYCRLTLAEDDVIALDDVGRSEYNQENFYLEFGLESYIAVPLRTNGAVFGTLNFSSPEPRRKPFTKADKDFVRLMGRWVSTMLERKHAEEQIQRSLKEKEFLLKEIHHRVKNNLQIISSLISLQSDYMRGKDALELFDECQSRISTIALIHEQLYQSKNITEINMADYVTTLTNYLLSVFDDAGCSIDVRIDTHDISVDIDTAIPCGLIINELFSNCLKHAFRPPGKGRGKESKIGTISVEIRTDGDRNIALSVTDDGCGFPERLNFRKTKTLGLQLICALTEQLNGTVELRNQKGTEFIVKFPATGNSRVV